ncbi:MAG TPA: protease inhibitor I42 family protein [Polyangiaceae bacterium]|jgi:predicted secreted protein
MIRPALALVALSLVSRSGCNTPPPNVPDTSTLGGLDAAPAVPEAGAPVDIEAGAPSAPDAAAAAAVDAGGGSGGDGAATSETVVHVEDDGKTVDLAAGATLTVKLASHSGTGYAWMPAKVDAAVLSQVGDRTSEISSSTPGAPKLDVYHFTAVKAGTTTLQMDLKRPFGNAPPGKTIKITVKVH